MTAKEVQKALRKLADREKAKILQGFFKTGPGEYGEGDRFLGIRVPALRKLARRHRELAPRDTLTLVRSRFHEERLLGLLIWVLRFEKGDDAIRRRVYDAYLDNLDFVNNWDLVDSSAHKIVGEYLRDRSRRPLYRLAKSTVMWERRVAMIATYAYIRTGDFADGLAIAERLVDDREDLIHKAVGWMLREIGNRDRQSEEIFLKKYYRTMPRTMLRYAIEKFPEPLRKRYLAGTAH